MHKTLLALSFLLFLSAPALAQSDDSCSPNTDSIDYVQLGDDIILVECPAMEGASCSCHAPPGEDGKCRVYACNADGVEHVAKKPEPAVTQEEKAASFPAQEEKKKLKPRKKLKPPPAEEQKEAAPPVEEKKAEPPPPEEKKVETPPAPEATQPAPAAAGEKKIEYTR